MNKFVLAFWPLLISGHGLLLHPSTILCQHLLFALKREPHLLFCLVCLLSEIRTLTAPTQTTSLASLDAVPSLIMGKLNNCTLDWKARETQPSQEISYPGFCCDMKLTFHLSFWNFSHRGEQGRLVLPISPSLAIAQFWIK